MLNYFTKQKTVVKPMEHNNEATQWGVFEMSVLDDLHDDFYRYGLIVMLKNLLWYLGDYWGTLHGTNVGFD